jgi:hypothetical protein
MAKGYSGVAAESGRTSKDRTPWTAGCGAAAGTPGAAAQVRATRTVSRIGVLDIDKPPLVSVA